MKLRNVAIVGFAQAPTSAGDPHRTETEMLYPVVKRALSGCGVERDAIDYQCAGSSDYLTGRAFSFSQALDVMGTWPPRQDSHLEMDAAWAAHYVWLRMQAEECDTAMVCGFGKTSEGHPRQVFNIQLDPFYLQPLGLDHVSTAALQASAYLARSGAGDAELAEIAARDRSSGAKNPEAQLREPASAAELARTPFEVAPLRKGYLPPLGESATCIVLAAEGKAEKLCDRPVWIHGVDHRTELPTIGARDLTRSASAKLAAEKALAMAGLARAAEVDLIELMSTNPVEEMILREAIGLEARGASPGKGGLVLNPSGGPLTANPFYSTGIIRLGEAFRQLAGRAGERAVPGARRAIAHAASGHCLQQNLFWVLGTERRWS
jgi:acetyl-CoA acetyltransferase